MKLKCSSISVKLAVVCAGLAIGALSNTSACTWFILHNDQGNCFVGRTMEWGDDLKTKITIVPRNHELGFEKKFKTQYGFVGMSHSGLFSDGENEHGLACSALWLPGTKYSAKKENGYNVADVSSYVLGNMKTVDEAVAFFKANTFYATMIPATKVLPEFHFAIADPSGRSVVVEFMNGETIIHENKVGVMTNEPRYEEHLKNWSKYEGKRFSEYTFEAFDYSSEARFNRMAAMKTLVTKMPTDMDAVNRAWSMLNTVDIPIGILYWRNITDDPQFTPYSVVDDLKNRIYYFRTYENYDVRKIDLSKIDFATVQYKSASVYGGVNYKEMNF